MFFIASKVIFFCIQPSTLAFLALLLGVLLVGRNPKWGRRILYAGLAIIVIFGFLPTGNILVLPLEERFAVACSTGTARKYQRHHSARWIRGWFDHAGSRRVGSQ